MAKKKSVGCEYCSNYVYDEDYEYYVCDINLDEDEMARFMSYSDWDCPYFQMDDEYKIVRKQMQKQRIRGMHRDSVYRRVSLDGIVKEQPEVLRELEEIVGFIRWNSKRTDKRSNGSG